VSGDYRVVAVEDGGTVRVRVRLKGAPASLPRIEVKKDTTKGCVDHASERVKVAPDGSLGNAIVSLRGLAAGKDWPPAWRGEDRALVVDQKGCIYVPHVAVIPPGTQLVILNSDAAEHNIHGYKGDFSNTKFNVSSPPGSRVACTGPTRGSRHVPGEVRHPPLTTQFTSWRRTRTTSGERGPTPRGIEAGEAVATDVPPGTYEVVVAQDGRDAGPLRRQDLGLRPQRRRGRERRSRHRDLREPWRTRSRSRTVSPPQRAGRRAPGGPAASRAPIRLRSPS
jgi:hypothetical protein